LFIDIDLKNPDKREEVKGGYAMRKIGVFLLAAFIFGSAAHAKEYAIIKDSMFGSQKIELYQTLKDALGNYSGEGKIYEIVRKEVPIKRIESKKKIEVSEYKWIVNEKKEKNENNEKEEKGSTDNAKK
jgi:hypothetical protein